METMTAVLPAPRLLNIGDIRECLADGSHLLLAERRKEAGDRIWSAFEASVRLSLTELGEQTEDPIWISNSPEGLSSQAVAYGVINPEDRGTLMRFLSERDAVSGHSQTIDAETLRQIEYITVRTLDEMKQQQEKEALVTLGPVIYPPHPITFAQYMAEEQVKRRYDIVNGVRVFAVPPSLRHQQIVGRFLSLFDDYATPHGYATLFSLFDVLISREPFCTRQPDVMLVSETKMQSHKDGEPLSFPPEMVIEIVSSIDRDLALEGKQRDYRALGVRECWVVRLDAKTIEVLTLADGASRVFGRGEVAASQQFEGLTAPVDAIFEEN